MLPLQLTAAASSCLDDPEPYMKEAPPEDPTAAATDATVDAVVADGAVVDAGLSEAIQSNATTQQRPRLSAFSVSSMAVAEFIVTSAAPHAPLFWSPSCRR